MTPVECSTPLRPSISVNVLEKTIENPVRKETTIDDPKENDLMTFISSMSTEYVLSSPLQDDSKLCDCENNSPLCHCSSTLSAKQCRPAKRSSKRSLNATLRESQQKERTMTSTSPSDSPKKLKSATAFPNDQLNVWLKIFSIPSRWEPDVERGISKGILSNLEKSALQFWAKKIEDRILNLRRRDARNERKRLQEDGVVLPKGKPGRKKKERKGDALPAIPDGETPERMESQRKKLVAIYNNGVYDLKHVTMLMDNTFTQRRRDVLVNNTRVWKLLQDYPVLKDNKGIQIKSELGRILGREAGLMSDVRAAWDSKKPSILAALEKSKNKDVQRIIGLLEDCDPGQEKEMENRCIFVALPHQLGEKTTYKHTPGQLFWEIVPDDSGVEISSIVKKSTSPKLLSTGSLNDIHSLALVTEGMIVIKFKQFSTLNAVVCLLAAFYVFNAEYPKAGGGQTKNVFLFLDQLLFSTEGKPNMPIGVENFLSLL